MTSVNSTAANIFAQLGLSTSSNSTSSGTSGTSGSSSSSSASSTSPTANESQFMNLMIAQLQNQDPLQPMDNGQFLSQLAQFQTASGVQQINQSFGQLSSALDSNQALQASTLVGRSVLAPSKVGMLTSGGTLDGTVTLPTAVGDLAVNIYDSSGQLVRHMDLGSHTSGTTAFTWDGKDSSGNALPPGQYTVKAVDQSGGKQTALSTDINAQVESVTLGQNGSPPVLNLAGIGPVDFSKIKQVM